MFEFDAGAPNVLPSRYRQVAIASHVPSLRAEDLERHFKGREAYMRTRFIVARKGGETALVEVDRPNSSKLFSAVEAVRVLALPSECQYIEDPDIDCGVPSQLAAAAWRSRGARCVVVEGRYSHVSFILNPAPLQLRVLDIVPPFPSKLLDQVERVLADAEHLPPIVALPHLVDSREELMAAQVPRERVLVPCRGSGIDLPDTEVSYLDERPALPDGADWTLLGCERSHQIHRWFYGSAPRSVDVCPVRFAAGAAADGPLLTRCCLLQEGIEDRRHGMFVPWGASLDEVHQAIEAIVRKEKPAWTPT